MQMLYAVNDDTPIHLDLDDRAHFLQKLDQVDNLRFQGSILNGSDPFCQRCGNQKILGRHHAGERQLDGGSMKPCGSTEIVATVTFDDFRSHLQQTVDMKVERTQADAISSGHGYIGLSTTMKQRSYADDRHTIKTADPCFNVRIID